MCNRVALSIAAVLAALNCCAPLSCYAVTKEKDFPDRARLEAVGQVTGLKLPRFVSLKSAETNLRKGPGSRFPSKYVYHRKGYPMQVVAEFENWRKLRDHDGTEGWVHENLISGYRNALVISNAYRTANKVYNKSVGELVLFRYPDETSYPMLRMQIGAIGKIKKCKQEWCLMKTEKGSGWVLKSNIWGVLQDEVFE